MSHVLQLLYSYPTHKRLYTDSYVRLCQSVQCSDDFLEKLSSISSDLKTTMSNILATELSEVQWRQATLPLRHGGIRDPSLLYPASSRGGVPLSPAGSMQFGWVH